MKITIVLRTDNAAFENDGNGQMPETAEVLANVARRFDTDGPYDGPIFDANGNTCGSVTVEDR